MISRLLVLRTFSKSCNWFKVGRISATVHPLSIHLCVSKCKCHWKNGKREDKKLIITDTIIYVFIKWQNGCKLIATESITSKTKLHRKKDNNFPILFSLFKKQHSSSTWSYPSILFHVVLFRVVRLLAGLLRLNSHPLYS